MEMVNADRVATIIVKDMSRLGRDYLKVGYYTEILFPENGIRFIAVNNGVDSNNQADSDFTPFLNIINEWYAKDTSKKIRAVFKNRGEAGKPLTFIPCYGYVKDPDDKDYWLVDNDAAKVVKDIFHLCVKGYGISQIADILTERKIPIPEYHKRKVGIISTAFPEHLDMYKWHSSTIAHILEKEEYLGHIVNFRTHKKSYKNKKKVKNPKEEWVIFENAHEAIIDQETFDIVQRIRDGRRRLTPMGEPPILSGMLYCADCGKKLYQVRSRAFDESKNHFVCSTYRKLKGGCSSHQIRNIVVEQLLLEDLQRITSFAREHEAEFIKLVSDKNKKAINQSLKDAKRKYEQSKARISKLDTIIQRLYEDNIEGKISDDRFAKLSTTYEQEQTQLINRINELDDIINIANNNAINTQSFLKLVRKYTDIKKLDAELIREFVEKIIVYKAETIDGHRTQKIQIVYNCIGAVNIPSTTKEKAA